MNPLIKSVWVHAKTPHANLFLRGFELTETGEHSALLDDKPHPFTMNFVADVERLTGCKFLCSPLDEATQLQLEYDRTLTAYQKLIQKRFWTSADYRNAPAITRKLWLLQKEIDNA